MTSTLITCFFYAFSSNLLFTCLPSFISKANGTPTHIGLSLGLFFLFYVITLNILNHSKLKRDSSKLIKTGFSLVIGPVVLLALSTHGSINSSITIILTIASLAGISQAFIWPNFITVLTANSQGEALNKRIGLFNTTWTSAMCLSPWLGGIILEQSYTAAAILIVLGYGSGLIVSLFINSPKIIKGPEIENNKICNDKIMIYLTRVTFIVSCMIIIVFKTQLKPYATEILKSSDSTFGTAITLVNIGCIVGGFMISKLHKYLNLKWPLYAIEIIAIIAILPLAYYNQSIVVVYISSFIIGFHWIYTYAAHLYHTSSNASESTKAATVHETILSISLVVGSIGGGLIAETALSAVFMVAIGLIITSIGLKIISQQYKHFVI